MGSAFTFPCIDNKHDVTLVGSPLENDQIENLNKDSFHKHLNCKLSDKIVFLNSKSLNEEIKKKYDVIVLGVNSKGINWISSELNSSNSKTPLLLLTKGLSVKNDKLEILTNLFKNPNVSAVAGPCLAKDLSKRNMLRKKKIKTKKDILIISFVIFLSENIILLFNMTLGWTSLYISIKNPLTKI